MSDPTIPTPAPRPRSSPALIWLTTMATVVVVIFAGEKYADASNRAKAARECAIAAEIYYNVHYTDVPRPSENGNCDNLK